MSRERLRVAHAGLAAAIEHRADAHRVAERAEQSVRDHEAAVSGLGEVDRRIAQHHKDQMKGGTTFALPADLADEKRRADEVRVNLVGIRAARDELVTERDEADETEKAARDAVTEASGAVMGDEAASMAAELLEAKARAITLEGSLRALSAIWLPRVRQSPLPRPMGPIRLPDVVGSALVAPATYADVPRPIHAPNPHATSWNNYLRALQADPDATRSEKETP